MKLKRIKTISALIGLTLCFQACQQETDCPGEGEDNIQWTKTLIYGADKDKTYFDDQDDDDFSEYSAIIYDIIQGVYAGELQAYEYWTGDPISADSAKNLLNVVDTVYVEQADSLGLKKKVVVVNYEEDIPSIKIKEQWHLDKENWKLKKKVLAVAPRVPVLSDDGVLRGYSPLFWVFLDEEAEVRFVEGK